MKTYNIPVEATLQVIGGKWKVVILCHLKKDKKENVRIKTINVWYYTKDVNATIT